MPPITAHLRVRPGEIGKLAVTAGDPARVEQVSSLLGAPKLVNDNRGMLVYTGEFGGKKVTVATHGMGGPSAAIVFEELRMLGAEVIVRLGTCGALVKGLRVGDFVVPTGAAFSEGSLKAHVPDGVLPAVPDLELTHGIAQRCVGKRFKCRVGPVFSSDVFYGQKEALVGRWAKMGVIAVEMECATLFTLSVLRGFKSAALLVVSDSLVDKSQAELAQADELRGPVERAGKIILETITASTGRKP